MWTPTVYPSSSSTSASSRVAGGVVPMFVPNVASSKSMSNGGVDSSMGVGRVRNHASDLVPVNPLALGGGGTTAAVRGATVNAQPSRIPVRGGGRRREPPSVPGSSSSASALSQQQRWTNMAKGKPAMGSLRKREDASSSFALYHVSKEESSRSPPPGKRQASSPPSSLLPSPRDRNGAAGMMGAAGPAHAMSEDSLEHYVELSHVQPSVVSSSSSSNHRHIPHVGSLFPTAHSVSRAAPPPPPLKSGSAYPYSSSSGNTSPRDKISPRRTESGGYAALHAAATRSYGTKNSIRRVGDEDEQLVNPLHNAALRSRPAPSISQRPQYPHPGVNDPIVSDQFTGMQQKRSNPATNVSSRSDLEKRQVLYSNSWMEPGEDLVEGDGIVEDVSPRHVRHRLDDPIAPQPLSPRSSGVSNSSRSRPDRSNARAALASLNEKRASVQPHRTPPPIPTEATDYVAASRRPPPPPPDQFDYSAAISQHQQLRGTIVREQEVPPLLIARGNRRPDVFGDTSTLRKQSLASIDDVQILDATQPLSTSSSTSSSTAMQTVHARKPSNSSVLSGNRSPIPSPRNQRPLSVIEQAIMPPPPTPPVHERDDSDAIHPQNSGIPRKAAPLGPPARSGPTPAPQSKPMSSLIVQPDSAVVPFVPSPSQSDSTPIPDRKQFHPAVLESIQSLPSVSTFFPPSPNQDGSPKQRSPPSLYPTSGNVLGKNGSVQSVDSPEQLSSSPSAIPNPLHLRLAGDSRPRTLPGMQKGERPKRVDEQRDEEMLALTSVSPIGDQAKSSPTRQPPPPPPESVASVDDVGSIGESRRGIPPPISSPRRPPPLVENQTEGPISSKVSYVNFGGSDSRPVSSRQQSPVSSANVTPMGPMSDSNPNQIHQYQQQGRMAPMSTPLVTLLVLAAHLDTMDSAPLAMDCVKQAVDALGQNHAMRVDVRFLNVHIPYLDPAETSTSLFSEKVEELSNSLPCDASVVSVSSLPNSPSSTTVFMLLMNAKGPLLHPSKGFGPLWKFLKSEVGGGRVVFAVFDDHMMGAHLKRQKKAASKAAFSQSVADPTLCASPELVGYLANQAELRDAEMNGQRALLLSFALRKSKRKQQSGNADSTILGHSVRTDYSMHVERLKSFLNNAVRMQVSGGGGPSSSGSIPLPVRRRMDVAIVYDSTVDFNNTGVTALLQSVSSLCHDIGSLDAMAYAVNPKDPSTFPPALQGKRILLVLNAKVPRWLLNDPLGMQALHVYLQECSTTAPILYLVVEDKASKKLPQGATYSEEVKVKFSASLQTDQMDGQRGMVVSMMRNADTIHQVAVAYWLLNPRSKFDANEAMSLGKDTDDPKLRYENAKEGCTIL